MSPANGTATTIAVAIRARRESRGSGASAASIVLASHSKIMGLFTRLGDAETSIVPSELIGRKANFMTSTIGQPGRAFSLPINRKCRCGCHVQPVTSVCDSASLPFSERCSKQFGQNRASDSMGRTTVNCHSRRVTPGRRAIPLPILRRPVLAQVKWISVNRPVARLAVSEVRSGLCNHELRPDTGEESYS